MRRWTVEEKRWLAENYPHEPADWCARHLALEFGHERTKRAVAMMARALGAKKEPAALPPTARAVRWSEEPVMQAWMEDNDDGCSAARLSRMFEAEFGFALSAKQISAWRSANGRQTRAYRKQQPALPVGAERDSGRGYVFVKVAEHPSRPQSGDNWRMKHVVAYEREHGEVPDGCNVVFADGDHGNFDPGNLVAVPRRLAALLNSPSCPGWHDAESLGAAMAWAELTLGICRAEAEAPRACDSCGRLFAPGYGASSDEARRNVRTCPECREKGRRARHKPRDENVVCAVCGDVFSPYNRRQLRCPACVARHPKWSAELQIAAEKRPRG